MRLVTTFIQNTESTDPDLSYLNRARFVLSVADGHGSDGVGILDAVIRNRHLFLSMTSGAEIDAGSVFTEDDLPVASDSRLGIAAFDPAYFSILAGKVSLRGDLDFGLNETQLAEYLTANKYATQAWVAAQGFIGSDGLALYATREWVLGQNFAKASSLDNYLLKSVWDEVFEVTTVNGVHVLNVKMDIAGLKGISAYGLGSTSGSGTSGSLGDLVNVGQWADEVPAADRVMVQLAGATHWSAKPLADLVGLDTTALAQYLTENSYLKASDISSYLTWANLSGKPTVYPTSWELVTGRPTKLSDLTDDVVSGKYLSKPTWDAVFEVVTVDGTPTLKVKYDILGLKGITAYADGTPSGGFSGALVDLVDVAVTNLASGDILKYNGTHFVNVPVSSIAGASSWDQITGKPEYFPTRWADVSGAPTSLPASDVYPWAKASTKPTYTAAEVGALALSGGVLAGDVYLGGGLAIRDNTASHSNVIGLLNTGDGTFFTAVGSGSRRMVLYSSVDLYRDNGSTQYRIYDSSNFNPSSKLDKSVWDEAFELKTVNGVRVISAKLDFLSVAGISAYATGPSSGGGGGGLDYDLLKQALTGAITPDGYPFTISTSFLGAIDKTYLTGKLANTYADKVHTHLWADITDRPTALPANGGNAESAIKDGNGNVIANTYLPLTGGTMTGDITFGSNGRSLRGSDGGNIAGVLYDTPNARYVTAIGTGSRRLILVSPASIYRGVGGVAENYMIYDSGNFNPDNYLPLSGGNVSGGLGVSGYLTAGVLRVKASSYPQVSFVNTTTNRDSLLFVNGSELYWRPTAGTATDYKIYHSGNFNPDSKLGVSSVAVEAKKMSYQGLMTAISGTTTFPAGLYLYGVYNNGYPVTYGNLLRVGGSGLGEMLFGWAGDASVGGLYYRSKRDVAATAWSNWCKLWTSANSNLSTVDWSANNLNAAANLDVAGQAYVSGWLRSRGDVGWYSQDYGGGIHMTDSTWVRVYGSKGLMIDTGTSHINMGQLQIACSAEASIGFRSASNGNWCLGKGVSSIGSGFGLYNAVTNRVAFQIASATDAASFASSITAAGSVVSMDTVESRRDKSTGTLPQMLWHIPGVTYARIRMANNGTLHVLSGGSEAYQSLYAHGFVAAGNVTAAGTVTAPTFVGNLSGSASLVNGYDINSFTGYYKYTIDASSLDQNTYYPVTVNLGSNHTVRISVIVALNSGTRPGWSTHTSGFSVRFIEEVNGSGWGVSVVSRNILANEYGFANANPVGRVEQMTNSSTEVIWVRGGGKYFFYLSIPYITLELRTSTFTASNQSVSPRTDTMDLRTSVSGSGIAVNKLYAHNSIVIGGITIDVYNGALRVNGNLVATGGVTAYQ